MSERPQLKVVAAEGWHMPVVYANLREHDRREVEHAGYDSAESLEQALRMSQVAWTLIEGDEPVAIIGLMPDPEESEVGIPWFLATRRLDNPSVRFHVARASRKYLGIMLQRYRTLRNWVAVDNKTSIRWLRWLGFAISKRVLAGACGGQFYEISLGGAS